MNHSAVEAGDNKLGLPKGHRNKNEDLYICASRELKEETGIMIRIHPKDPCVIVSDTAYFILKVFKNIHTNPQDNKEIHSCSWELITKLLNSTCNRGLRILMNKYRNDEEFRNTLMNVKPRLAICVRKRPEDKSLKNDRYSPDSTVSHKNELSRFVSESSGSSSDPDIETETDAEIFSEGIFRATDYYDI